MYLRFLTLVKNRLSMDKIDILSVKNISTRNGSHFHQDYDGEKLQMNWKIAHIIEIKTFFFGK